MDSARSPMNSTIPRILLGLSNPLIFASSAILTGILSWFLHRYAYRNTHLVYMEVIAVLTLFIYLFTLVLPFLKSYRGYLQPLNMILSYLWLPSLIFSSQDYSGHRCHYHSPPGVDHCRLKHTIQAFQILGFTMLFFNSVLEAIMWALSRAQRNPSGLEKGVTSKVPGTTVPCSQCHTNGDGLRQTV